MNTNCSLADVVITPNDMVRLPEFWGLWFALLITLASVVGLLMLVCPCLMRGCGSHQHQAGASPVQPQQQQQQLQTPSSSIDRLAIEMDKFVDGADVEDNDDSTGDDDDAEPKQTEATTPVESSLREQLQQYRNSRTFAEFLMWRRQRMQAAKERKKRKQARVYKGDISSSTAPVSAAMDTSSMSSSGASVVVSAERNQRTPTHTIDNVDDEEEIRFDSSAN